MSQSLLNIIDLLIDKYTETLSNQYGIPKEELKQYWNQMDEKIEDEKESLISTTRDLEEDVSTVLENLQKMKIMELKNLCKQYGIKKNGNKNELIQILTKYIEDSKPKKSNFDDLFEISSSMNSKRSSQPNQITYHPIEDEEDYDFGDFVDESVSSSESEEEENEFI